MARIDIVGTGNIIGHYFDSTGGLAPDTALGSVATGTGEGDQPVSDEAR